MANIGLQSSLYQWFSYVSKLLAQNKAHSNIQTKLNKAIEMMSSNSYTNKIISRDFIIQNYSKEVRKNEC